MLGTMADAYVNSVMVDALILGREGTTIPETSSYAPALPTVGDLTQMARWEPWVRAYVAIGELCRNQFSDDSDILPGPVVRIVDCGNRTSEQSDLRGDRFRWC